MTNSSRAKKAEVSSKKGSKGKSRNNEKDYYAGDDWWSDEETANFEFDSDVDVLDGNFPGRSVSHVTYDA